MATELTQEEFEEKFFPMTYEQGNQIESLLMSCAIPEFRERTIRYEYLNEKYTDEEADEVIEYLWQNQVDPISAGKTYQQGDISRKLRKMKPDCNKCFKDGRFK